MLKGGPWDGGIGQAITGQEPSSSATESALSQGNPPSPPEAITPSLPSINLPRGGGAIRGMGEKFAVNPVTGAGSLTVPIPLSAGCSGFTPQLTLAYDSGAGNGPFGFGWSLSLPAVTRKTDKGLPRYLDGDESDVFILSGAEDLVPVLDANGQRVRTSRTVHGIDYLVCPYRPRVENLYARIERWERVDTGVSHWRSISKDNVTTLYGFEPDSRIADPDDPRRIFSYLVCRTWDDRGNLTVYAYRPDDNAGIDVSQAHEANRTDAVRGTQRYLDTIRYGNSQPYFPDWSPGGQETPLPFDWHFEVAVDYGGRPTGETSEAPASWPVRPDPFSFYRAGFEVRTYRRASRILMLHNFPDQPDVGTGCLVRSLDMAYSDEKSPADPRNPLYTMLVAITQAGHRRDGRGYASRSLPPLELEYSKVSVQPDVLAVEAAARVGLPQGVDGADHRWADLDGEALAGILTDEGGSWSYKRNRSPLNQVSQPDGSLAARADFSPPEPLTRVPSRSGLAGQQLLDLDGSGTLDLVQLAQPAPGFYSRNPDRGLGWGPFRSFQSLPGIDWNDPNLRFVDLTGDGLADVLLTEDGLFTFYASLGAAGFDRAVTVRIPWDEERGPKLVLADGTQTVFLADMSGDGMSDLVRVRDGEVSYWPNLGYGRFGRRVSMDRAPRLAGQERFDPSRVRLADIDGTGTADLLYVGAGGVQVYFNQSGNAWSQPTLLGVFPSADSLSSVQVTDLLGTGTACLVWSSPLPAEASSPMRYVDLMGGTKPHLLVTSRNNLGAETRLTYAPSTRFYLADRDAGRPWVTRLPHVVHVVERMETLDWIGRNRLVSRYAYHHGHFDGFEREFCGFGMVEQWDTDEFRSDTAFPDGEALNWDASSFSPPVLTRTWFHTGAFEEAGLLSRQFAHEYWTEPALRGPARAADLAALLLPDSVVEPAAIDPGEMREARRALRGQALRTEVYALDGTATADDPNGQPYTVTERNFTVRRLQPMAGNGHAVFDVHPREELTFHYERNPADPRVTHNVTLEVDEFGNVRRAVSIGYPRRNGSVEPEPGLSQAFQDMLAYDQGRLHVLATDHGYTNASTDPAKDFHRAPLPASMTAREITGVSPGDTRFDFQTLDGLWARGDLTALAYESIPASDVDGKEVAASSPSARVVEERWILYRSDDLSRLLPAGVVESMALPGETYRGALTSGLISAILGSLLADPAATLAEAGYVSLPGERGFWMPSGRVFYSGGTGDRPDQELAAARAHFYLPRRVVDPFGGITRIDYDTHDLLPATATDPVGNVTSATSDYRVLQPALVTDANGNRAQVAFDVLGQVAGTAVMGKVGESLGDSLAVFVADPDQAIVLAHLSDPLADPESLLGTATTRVVYDHDAYYRTSTDPQPAPPAVYTLARETHLSDRAPGETSRFQHTFTYSDGFGREIQRKAQAEPGPVMDGGPDVMPRWVGSGWTIFDNKGRPVRRYEPFFSTVSAFEFAAQVGVSSVLFYDPPGRQVAALHPDDTWEKVVFDAWRQESWDPNDTVLVDDPRTDPDVGDHFKRLLGSVPFASWYRQRMDGIIGATPEEQAARRDAAQKAAAHATTPSVVHLDALGRTCLSVQDNGPGGRYPTRTALDTEGKPLAVFDALGRRVVEHCLRIPGGPTPYLAGWDLAGQPLYEIGMDSGARRTLMTVTGQPCRTWDARGHAFRTRYDLARRPTHRYVSTDGAAEILLERSVYGEGFAAANLCDRLFLHYDTAGVVINERYDYKGNLLVSTRQLAADYHRSPDWTPLADLTDPGQLDAAAAPLLSAQDRFRGSSTFDALNRPIQVVTPHSLDMKPNVIRHLYNEANLLDRVDAWLQQPAAPTGLLDPATADLHAVTGIQYNARRQRVRLAFGNGAVTGYAYDPLTFRLVHLTTTRSGFPSDQQSLQDLSYFYDPVGNITRIRDTADIQNVVYFRNRRVEPSNDYTYDPVYRLVAAVGREHLGQTNGLHNPPQQVADDDSFRMNQPLPGDGNAMGQYTETYTYDAVGNILTMAHRVDSGGWTRRYSYAEPSWIDPAKTGNRLTSTSLPGDPAAGPLTATYTHDAHGNMTRMPHLPVMTWDEQDRLSATAMQVVNAGVPETTFYQYDGGGQRVRKATDSTTAVSQADRVYLGDVELHRVFGGGISMEFQRETLHVSGGSHPICLVETRTAGIDPGSSQLVRYQHSNHLRSAVLELDDHAQIITYEEFLPFGSTTCLAVAAPRETPKRYRYSAKERDEETRLGYHNARYYIPWLGRWTGCDPLGLAGGLNTVAYSSDNPVAFVDPTGTADRPTTIRRSAQRIADLKETTWRDPTGRVSRAVKGYLKNQLAQKGSWYRVKAPPGWQASHPLGNPFRTHGESGGPLVYKDTAGNLMDLRVEKGWKPGKPSPLPEDIGPDPWRGTGGGSGQAGRTSPGDSGMGPGELPTSEVLGAESSISHNPSPVRSPVNTIVEAAGWAAIAGQAITQLHEGKPREAAMTVGTGVVITQVLSRVPALIPLAVMKASIDAYDQSVDQDAFAAGQRLAPHHPVIGGMVAAATATGESVFRGTFGVVGTAIGEGAAAAYIRLTSEKYTLVPWRSQLWERYLH